MENPISKVKDLVGADLSQLGFKIAEMTEVYSTDEDGRKREALGYFNDPVIAQGFAGNQNGGEAYTKTRTVLVLTNGNKGFVLEDQESIRLFDDEAEALKVKEAALKKLTLAERKILQR